MALKRLLSRLFNEPPPGDLATDDWTPVPVSATAQPQDALDWLRQQDAMPSRPVVAFAPVEPEEEPHQPDYLDYFSPAELAVIEEQQRAAPVSRAPAPPPPVSEPEALRPKPQASRWVDVLKRCGEHLTDAELQIIRRQLASS